MPQRPAINPPPVSEMFFGPDGTEKSVFDSFPKRIAKSVTELLGLDAPPDPSDFANPLGAVIGKPAQKMSQQVIKTLSGETVPKGIRAYHGSPHQPFNRFDMNQIGTGEGAQAYGHGLYFAEAEDVAKTYRDVLSESAVSVADGVKYSSHDVGTNPVARAAKALAEHSGNTEAARRSLWDASVASYTKDRADFLHSALREVDGVVRRGGSEFGTGSLSEVNLRVRPEELLDLDKTLSQQPFLPEGSMQDIIARVKSEGRRPTLQEKMAVNVQSPGYIGNTTGRGFIENLSQQTGSPRLASQVLRDAGIPGSRYLDGMSRSGGEGTRNIVMFDDDKIDIVKQLMLLLGLGAPAASAAQGLAEPQRPVLEPSI